jgi:cardiolipin synthase A/B
MNINWLLVHLLSTIGFILALALLSHILRERRSPTSTLAWLMAIIFIPYLGVPFYLIFGGRKMVKKAETKPNLLYDPLKFPPNSSLNNAHLFASNGGIFPPSAQNQITFLPEGEQAFQKAIELIQNARDSIYIATFILGKDETGRSILDALAEKASRGVKIYLLLDALGSVRLPRKFLSPLIAAGGQVAFFMPMIHLPFRGRANLRNHRKMIISDNQVALIGGMNLASEYMGPQPSSERWQDLSLAIHGPAVEHVIEIFKSDWRFAKKTELETDLTASAPQEPDEGGIIQVIASGPDVRNDSLRNAILTAIFKASQRVWVVTPYFIPDELLLEALCIAVNRGVDVSVIIPEKSNHRLADMVREGYLMRIQEAGAGIWLYEPRMLHAKAILVDSALAIVGSANMDMRSLLLNYEVALCIHDANLIKQLETWMIGLREDSSRQQMQTKGSFELIKGMGRLFAPLL